MDLFDALSVNMHTALQEKVQLKNSVIRIT